MSPRTRALLLAWGRALLSVAVVVVASAAASPSERPATAPLVALAIRELLRAVNEGRVPLPARWIPFVAAGLGVLAGVLGDLLAGMDAWRAVAYGFGAGGGAVFLNEAAKMAKGGKKGDSEVAQKR